MKNNRKNRKLSFIREKNKVRDGSTLFVFAKVGDEIMSVDITQMARAEAERFGKKYKTPLECIGIKTGIDHEDFFREITTVRFSLKRNLN